MPMLGKDWCTLKQPLLVLFEDISQGAERFTVPVVAGPFQNMDTMVFENLKYVTRIIDVSGHLKMRGFSENMSCECAGICGEQCACSSGVYTKNGKVGDMEHLMTNPIQECNENCECALYCGNRVAQKGATYPVEIFARDSKCGWGVRASTRIPYGTYIGEYTGELIDEDDASERDTTFLFETRLGSETYSIDAKYCGNYTRFINHSCEPNVRVGNVCWDSDEQQLTHLCFFTSKEIAKDEEFTIDYGDAWWANKKFSCLCKSPGCRYQNKESLT